MNMKLFFIYKIKQLNVFRMLMQQITKKGTHLKQLAEILLFADIDCLSSIFPTTCFGE